MKIKAVIAALLLSIAVMPKIHAFGVGAQLNFSAGDLLAPGASLLISPADYFHLAFNWYLDFDKVNTVGITADLSPLVLPITTFGAGSFNFTLGAGLFGNIVFKSDPDFNWGLRIPAGFNVLLGRSAFEIFTYVAPSFKVRFLPKLGLYEPFFPIALGARLWIR